MDTICGTQVYPQTRTRQTSHETDTQRDMTSTRKHAHIPLCVLVVDGDHLREVNHGDGVVVAAHEVELVEVAVDEPAVGQLQNQIHAVRVRLGRIREVLDLRDGRRGVGTRKLGK